MGHKSIEVIKINLRGNHVGLKEGRYAVIEDEEWEDFISHYHEVFSERDKAIELGTKLALGTKYHDSLVKFVRWVFTQLKEFTKLEDVSTRMEMPVSRLVMQATLDKLYELRLADQSYKEPGKPDGEYEFTPKDSRWFVHLQNDLREEHEHGNRAEESPEEDGPGEEPPPSIP